MRPFVTMASAFARAAVAFGPQAPPHRPDPNARAAHPLCAHDVTWQPLPCG